MNLKVKIAEFRTKTLAVNAPVKLLPAFELHKVFLIPQILDRISSSASRACSLLLLLPLPLLSVLVALFCLFKFFF
jgi:hypothetical protein